MDFSVKGNPSLIIKWERGEYGMGPLRAGPMGGVNGVGH